MCSTRGLNDESYEFFDDIDKYRNYEEEIKSTATTEDINTCCTSVMKGGNSSRKNEIPKNICENFLKLYKLLPNVKQFNEKDWWFLNYKLNFELGQVNNNICVNEFYVDMENHCTKIIQDLLLKELIYNVKKDDLNKMNLLYGLYENYKKLDNILSGPKPVDASSLLVPSAKCCSDYAEANYLCNDENNEFCTQLKKFKEKYDGLYNTEIEGKPEYTNNFKKLSECKKNNVMTTALIGTTVGLVPLMMGVYKFTPLRQLINSNKGKLTQEYRYNDEDMRNIIINDQEREQISSQQERYNIKYHSV